MILSGARRAAEVPDRLRAFGVDPLGMLAVCTLAFADGKEAVLPGVAEVFADFFLEQGTAAVVAASSQDVVAVLAWRRPAAELRPLAERLCDAVRNRFADRRPVVGLGDIAASGTGLRRSLGQSREACRVLRRRRGPGVASYAELGARRLLLGLHDTEALGEFADALLAPLRDHDGRHGGELEHTLRVFLHHDAHFADSAAALYVHVNTLRNRLARIAEVTGRDIGRTEDRVELFLALEADAMR